MSEPWQHSSSGEAWRLDSSGEPWRLDATDLAKLIRTGRLSAREATVSVLARMDAVNPQLNAVVQRFDAEALAAADAADAKQARGDALGPLHGVPVTIKVNIDQKGHATTNGIVAFKDAIAGEDSPVVANFRHAGAVIVGRTNTPAFSMRLVTSNDLHGRTFNPRDRAISPGGSSGGAGAAVAAGIGPIAHGNDIAGSVRVPAYCNGVVGLRVGLGRIAAFNPSQPVARGIGGQLMAVQGPLTRTVRDARLALAVMARGDARDTRWADVPLVGPPPPRPIRVALVPEIPGGFTHPAQAEAVRQAGRHLAAAGYQVEEILPPDIEQAVQAWHDIGSADVLAPLLPRMEELGDDAGRASMRAWMQLVPPKGLKAVLGALAMRDLLLGRWQTFFTHTPLVVMPTLAGLPPPQDQDTTLEGQIKVLDSIRACLIAPVLGLCGLSVPVGHHGALRTGVQINAARFREDLALDAGEVIEAAEGIVTPIDPRS
jgi:amidase